MNYEEFAGPLLKGYRGVEAYEMGKVMENLWKKRYIDAMESFKFMKDHLMKRKIAYARLKKYPEREIYEAKFKDIPFDRAILLKKEWHDTLAQENKWTAYEKRVYQKGLEELLALTDEAMKETVFSITEHSAHRKYHENNSILKKDEDELIQLVMMKAKEKERRNDFGLPRNIRPLIQSEPIEKETNAALIRTKEQERSVFK